jgi:putative ABC transport system permease protein
MPFVDTVWQDARRGARALAGTPGFTLAAVLTLALGIGANSAIFTVVNAVLLKPLPYADPDARVMIWSRWVGFDKTWVSLAEVNDYRTRATTTLQDVAAWQTTIVNLTGDGEPVRIGAARVTPNTFDVLGAAPLIGRTFTPADVAPGPPTVAIISYGLWQQRYAGDPNITTRTIQGSGQAVRVIGVMPQGFRLPTDFGEDAEEPTQAWVPLYVDPATVAQNRGNHGHYAAARLKPGATAASASAELAALTANLTREGLYPAAMRFNAFAVSLRDEVVGSVRPAVLLLSGAVAALLLIACANVASLLLARSEVRQREIALRCALGAGQWRLFRQLLTESAVLAVLAGIVGLLLASLGVRLLLAVDPTAVPRAETVGIDASVLLFTALVALATTVLFSLAPAMRALRVDLVEALKEGGHQGTVGVRRQHLRSLLVIGEMAVAVVLVIGAVLMIRSLWSLQRVDLGFDPARVLTMRVTLPQASYQKPEQVVALYHRLVERVRALPDVQSAGAIRSLPLANTIGDWGLDIDGFVETPGNNAKGDWQVATGGALEALGERLVRGRLLTASDTTDSAPVALINETFARVYFGERDPIGQRMRMGSNAERPWMTIVGVVADVRHNGVDALIKEKFYVPHAQFHRQTGYAPAGMALVVKTAGDPMRLAAPIRTGLRELDPNLPLANVRPMTEVVGTALATPRFTGWLLALFAALALTLSAVGIYGVLAFLVSQRTHEIGIRLAIGADSTRVLGMILARGLGLALIGVAAGLVAAFFLTGLIATQLHGIQPHDLATFIGVPILLACVALVASYIPARRAMRVDPLVALRSE